MSIGDLSFLAAHPINFISNQTTETQVRDVMIDEDELLNKEWERILKEEQ